MPPDGLSDNDIARLFQLLALLLFIAPGVLLLSRQQRRWVMLAAAGVLALGFLWALVKLGLWLAS